MTHIPRWMLVALLGLAIAVSGCVYNDDDDNDDGDDNGGATVGGGGGDDGGDDGDASGTVNARGSPGWGLIGSIGAVLGVGMLLRRK
jgi:hypothetical protein